MPQAAQNVSPTMIAGTGGASVSAAPAIHAAMTARMKRRRPSLAVIQPVIGAITVPAR